MFADGAAAATAPPGGHGRARWAAAAAGPSICGQWGVLRATRELALELWEQRVLAAQKLIFRRHFAKICFSRVKGL